MDKTDSTFDMRDLAHELTSIEAQITMDVDMPTDKEEAAAQSQIYSSLSHNYQTPTKKKTLASRVSSPRYAPYSPVKSLLRRKILQSGAKANAIEEMDVTYLDDEHSVKIEMKDGVDENMDVDENGIGNLMESDTQHMTPHPSPQIQAPEVEKSPMKMTEDLESKADLSDSTGKTTSDAGYENYDPSGDGVYSEGDEDSESRNSPTIITTMEYGFKGIRKKSHNNEVILSPFILVECSIA